MDADHPGHRRDSTIGFGLLWTRTGHSMRNWNSASVAHVERTNRALREKAQRLLRVARCNVEIYSTKAKIRRRTIASAHSFDTKSRDSGLIISRIYRSPHTGISRVPWTNLSILPSITSWTRETGKTPLFASESLVKSDGRGRESTSQQVHLPFLIPRGRRRRIEETRTAQDFLPAARAEHQSFPSLPKPRISRTMSFAYHYTPCIFPVQFALASCQSHPNQVRPSITSN